MKESAYIRALKALLDSSTPAEARSEVEKEFYGNSDRACGILQASWVEMALEDAILTRVKPRSRKIVDSAGLVSTFSSKINFCFEIEAFGPQTKHDLELIRVLRNAFAHSMHPLTFNTNEIRDVCGHLNLPDNNDIKKIPIAVLDSPDDTNTPRNRYLICCYTIVSLLLDMHFFSRASQLP